MKPKSLKYEMIPSTQVQDAARNYVSSLLNKSLKFPKLKIAGLSDNEQTVQKQVKGHLANMPGDFNRSRSYLQNVLQDEYDPETSRHYQGFRDQQQTQKKMAQSQVARSAQKAGTARSTPSLALENQVGFNYDALINQQLGALLQDERNFKGQAAQALPQINASQIQQTALADEIASKPRQIEQMRFQAAYDKIIQDLTAPYMYNANIASAILNEPRYASYETGGGMTDWGVLLNAATGFTTAHFAQRDNKGLWAGLNTSPGFGTPTPTGTVYA